MSYFTDFGMMELTHDIAATYCQLRARADDEASERILENAGDLLMQVEKLLKDRWEWSKKNPPAILRGE